MFAVLVIVAGRSHVAVGPQGDEPHYLMVAESLLRDGDLSLERDYAEGRYAAFHDAPLAPHYRVRGRGGEIYSLHAVGLSILILPAWALAGYAGVTVFMALLAALVAREVREWVRELTGRDGLAEAAGWLAVLTPPLVHYAGLVFTEVPAALALSLGLRARAVGRSPACGKCVAIGLAAAVLPWLNVRYGLLAAIVVAHALWRHPRRPTLVSLLAPCAGLGVRAAPLSLPPLRLLGPEPRLRAPVPSSRSRPCREGLPGLLLDQEFGLLVYAPVLALALPGVLYLFRRDRPLALAVARVRRGRGADRRHVAHVARRLQPAGPVPGADRAAAAGGGGARLGQARAHGRGGAPRGLVALHGARGRGGAGARPPRPRRHGAALPRAVGRPGVDGPAAGLRSRGPGPTSARARLVARAPVAALPWRTRAATATRLGAACLGLAVAAQAAASVSHQRTDDRDAVRLVGREALRVPGLRLARADARWPLEALGWGPLYEPHRHPAGAEVGRRLPLAAGSYRLAVAGQLLRGAAGARRRPRPSGRPRPDLAPGCADRLGGRFRCPAWGTGGQPVAAGGRACPRPRPRARVQPAAAGPV